MPNFIGETAEMIRIESCVYLASGTVKLVYQNPNWPNAVLKIVRPERVTENGFFVDQKSYKKMHATGVYRSFLREISQYAALCRKHHSTARYRFPIAAPIGLVPTDRGLALISELITLDEKILAPSIERLIAQKSFTRIHFDALKKFFEECERLHIGFGEVNVGGILFTTERTGEPEFVLVDGIGERNLIPLKSWFRFLNARRIREVEARIWKRIIESGVDVEAFQ